MNIDPSEASDNIEKVQSVAAYVSFDVASIYLLQRSLL